MSRRLEDDIEELKTPKDWDELARRMQTEVADAVADVFRRIEQTATDIEREVVELLADDLGHLPDVSGFRRDIDVRSLWTDAGVKPKGRHASDSVNTTITGLRGAQSGIIMFGMMARFLPAAIGSVLLFAPVTLGLGAAFGGFQLLDTHKRKLATRRQLARTNVRTFVDEVQFEVGNSINEVLRSVQRSFRDELGERVTELQRTYAETANAATEAARRDEAESAVRAEQVRARIQQLDTLWRALAALEAGT